MSEQRVKDPIAFINRMAAGLGLSGNRRRNRLLLFRVPKDWKGRIIHFGYTPWSDSDGKFYALKYRENKRTGIIMLAKKVGFARRKIARKRALQWYEAYYYKEKGKRSLELLEKDVIKNE